MSTFHFSDKDHPNLYFSFMVRLWQENANGPYRASAQSIQTGKLIQFATIDALIDFLKAQRFEESNAKPDAHEQKQ